MSSSGGSRHEGQLVGRLLSDQGLPEGPVGHDRTHQPDIHEHNCSEGLQQDTLLFRVVQHNEPRLYRRTGISRTQSDSEKTRTLNIALVALIHCIV